MKEAHQVRDRIPVVVPERHAIPLRGPITHRGKKLKRCKERIDAHALPCQGFQVGLFLGSDVLEVAAHAFER